MNKYVVEMINNRIAINLAITELFLAILMLLPVITSGFVSDDSFNSFMKGTHLYSHITLHESILNAIRGWLAIGRFVPLNLAYGFSFSTFINNLIIYKILIMIFIIINILTFCYFLKLVTGSTSLSVLSILIAPLFFQIRDYHDPILSFDILLPLVFLITLLSLISTAIYTHNMRKRYLLLSLILYLLGILTYEITYPFFILHFLIIYSQSFNKGTNYALRLSMPFLSLSILCISIPIILRLYLDIPLTGGSEYTTFGSGYIPNLSVSNYVITLTKQITAAIPLSFSIVHYVVNPSRIFSDLDLLFSAIPMSIAAAYFFLYLLISKKIIDEIHEQRKSQFNVKHLSIFGLALLILPGILVSSSPKYQRELTWGTGYIPVYISYFGLLILTLCFIYYIYDKYLNNEKLILLISLTFSIVFSITGSLTYTSNVNTIEDLNHYWLYPRIIIEDGLKDGLFKFVPNNSILLPDDNYPWEQPGFYLMHSGVRLQYIGCPLPVFSNGYLSKLPESALTGIYQDKYSYIFSDSDEVFYLRYFAQTRNEGYAVLGKVKGLLASNKILDNVTSKHTYIYVHHANNLFQANNISVGGFWSREGPSQKFLLDEGEMSLISRGSTWKLFSIDSGNRTIDMRSLYVDIVPTHNGSYS